MAETFFDKIYKNKTLHTPDVLSCLANLSNDEVFTPPDVVNQMLDLLPQELFSDPNATFLDPACKTGVFLREIAKRLLVGLADKIPDLQKRIDHVFHKQLYGIATHEFVIPPKFILLKISKRRILDFSFRYRRRQYTISPHKTYLDRRQVQILWCKQILRPWRRQRNSRLRIYTHDDTGENF